MYTGVPTVFVVPTSRMRIRSLVAALLTALSLLIVTSSARAQSTWVGFNNWNDGTNWSPSGIPGSTATAIFPDAATGGTPFVQWTSPIQIGQIQFPTTAQQYLFGPSGGTFELQINSVATIGIRNDSGIAQEFAAGTYRIGGSQTWSTSVSGGQTIFDVPVIGTGLSLTKTGVGELQFTTDATLTVGNFNVAGGLATFDNKNGVFTMSSGSINIGTTGNAATLQLGGIRNNQNNAIDANAVTITIGPTGTLDSAPDRQHQLGDVNLQGGVIQGTSSGTGAAFVFIDGKTVTTSGTTQSRFDISTRGIQLTVGGGAVNFNVGNGVSSVSGNPDLLVNVPISGTGALNKVGLGIMRLTQPNLTLSGPVNVNAGTLQLASPATGLPAGTGSGAVTVANAATLMGNGSLGGPLSVQGGGTVRPNNPTNNNPGKLSQTASTADFASGSTLGVRIGGDTNTDTDRSQLNTTGTLTFPNSGSGTWTVDVSKTTAYNPAGASTRTYTIAQASSIPSTGLDTQISLLMGAGTTTATNGTTTLRVTGFAAGSVFTLQKQGGNSLVLTFSPVPEPVGVLAVFGVGLGFAAWRRRARQLTSSVA
jgi:autotransporter-associated beta strand protein